MPPMDDNTTDLQSSEQVNDVTEQQAETPVEGIAEPSPAPDEPKDILSIVRDVVEDKSEDPASSADKDPLEADEPQDEIEDPVEPEDDDKVPFNKHPRWQEMRKKLKTAEEDAGEFRKIDSFLKQNNLPLEEAAEGLQIMAIAKVDPARALTMLKPFIQTLLVAAGEVLPDELKERVGNGEMTVEAARELSRARASVAQQQQLQEVDNQRRQQEALRDAAYARANAAQAWVEDRRLKDPSFESKKPQIEREVVYLQRSEGVPATPEGVRDQLNRAYKNVNASVRSSVPSVPRQGVRPVIGGSSNGNPAPQPTSMLDVVKQTLAQ